MFSKPTFVPRSFSFSHAAAALTWRKNMFGEKKCFGALSGFYDLHYPHLCVLKRCFVI